MQPALPRNIVVIDVERFSTRTNTEQLAIREGMYRAVEVAFTSADIPWTTCHVEDRGDGMMILISSDVPKLRLFERLPDLLNNELRAHNARVRDEVRIRLRIAIHAGEVYEDRQGVVADAVNQTFRLVATPLLKAALASSASDLVVIISDWCYQEVVRNHPSAQPQTYQRVDVAVKETRTMLDPRSRSGAGRCARQTGHRTVAGRGAADRPPGTHRPAPPDHPAGRHPVPVGRRLPRHTQRAGRPESACRHRPIDATSRVRDSLSPEAETTCVRHPDDMLQLPRRFCAIGGRRTHIRG